MDAWATLAEVGTAGLTVATLLFVGGKQVGRVEAAIGRLVGIEVKLAKVDEHSGQIGTVTDTVLRMRSDHKELREDVRGLEVKVDRQTETLAMIRGRLASTHDD